MPSDILPDGGVYLQTFRVSIILCLVVVFGINAQRRWLKSMREKREGKKKKEKISWGENVVSTVIKPLCRKNEIV